MMVVPIVVLTLLLLWLAGGPGAAIRLLDSLLRSAVEFVASLA